MRLRLSGQRHAWSALVTHTAGGPLVAVHVHIDFIDNLLYDFISGDGRYSLLHVIQRLKKFRKLLACGSFLVEVTIAPRIVLKANSTALLMHIYIHLSESHTSGYETYCIGT